MLKFDKDMVQSIMNYIDEFKTKPCDEYQFAYLKQACRTLLNYIPMMICDLDSGITRCRKNGKHLYQFKDDISYNKNINAIQQGRFNLAKQSMFYGSLPVYNDTGTIRNYGNQSPMFEVCKELQTHEPLSLPSFFTISFWETTRTLSVVSLCFEENHLANNSAIGKPTSQIRESIKAKYPPSIFECILNVWKYFSDLSTKWDTNNSHYYTILTAFYIAYSEYYMERNAVSIDGIIYPSAMTQAKGLNIALTPASVDNYLQLKAVQMYSLRHRGLPEGFEPISDVAMVSDDNFTFNDEFVKDYDLFNYFEPE